MENNQNITILRNLLDEDARKFTSAEIALKNTLTGWISQARSMQLKNVLHKYLEFVEQHVKKLEGFFEKEDINFISLNNRIMHAFIEETNEKLSSCSLAEVKDACLLAGVQGITHFKISTYGTAAAFAHIMDLKKAETLFCELEINEKQIDSRLSQLAEYDINVKALAPIALTE